MWKIVLQKKYNNKEMAKKIILAVLSFFYLEFYTQQYYGKEKFDKLPKVEFTLMNDTKIEGLLVAYNYPNGSYPSFFDKNNIYSFQYKKNENSETENIKANDVKKIQVFDQSGDPISTIEKLDMVAVDKNGDVTKKTKKSFQPLLYDGKIQIFGSNINICTNSICYYAYSEFYIKNTKDDFAVMPVDYDRINLLNIFSISDKLVEAFRYTGRNCPDFQKYMDIFEAKIKDKSFRKKMTSDLKEIRKKSFDDGKSQKLGHDGIQDLLGLRTQEYYLNLYSGIIKEFEKNCP